MTRQPARPARIAAAASLALFVAGSAASLAQVDNGWFPAESFLCGKVPTSGLVADVDQDGDLDVVTGNISSFDVTVLLGKGDGRLSPPMALTVAPGIQQVASGDVDGDGLVDLIALVGLQGGGHVGLALARGLPGGGFDEVDITTLPTSTSDELPRAMATGDVNADGRLDAVVIGSGGGPNAVVLRGTAVGFAPPLDIGLGNQPRVVELADVDGDGNLDLISGHALAPAGRLFVSLGDGVGGFTLHETKALGAEPRALTSGDLDLDGHRDVLVGVTDGVGEGGGTHSLAVFLGDGSGLLDGVPGKSLDHAPTELFLGLLDDDELPDLLAGLEALQGQRAATVFQGRGNGSFLKLSELDVPALALLGLGDIDEDGQLDLVSSQVQFGKNFAALRRGLGDGSFDVSLPFAFGELTQPIAATEEVLVADTTGDGLRDVLLAWGNPEQLAMFPGDGAGGFGVPRRRDLPEDPTDVELLDLNQDGLLDALVTVPDAPGALYVLRGNGPAGFAIPLELDPPELSGATHLVRSGDMDNDGVVDAITANHIGLTQDPDTRIGVWRGNGSLQLDPPLVSDFNLDSHQLRLADLNGDGDLDLLRAVSNPPRLVSMPGKGDGTFGIQATHSMGSGIFSIDFDVGDIDEDGMLDVAAIAIVAQDLYLLFGSGTGGFEEPVVEDLPTSAVDLDLVDLDLDTHLDIVMSAQGQSLVFPGRGAASFKPARFYQNLATGARRSQGDLDGDLYPDLVAASSFFPIMIVLPSRSSPWVDLGHAKPASVGTPTLFGAGPAEPGTSYVQGWQGPPSAFALMIIGSSIAELPFQGGVLVPSPDLVIPVPPVLSIDATWDDALPAGLLVALQVWFEAGGETSASNALAVVIES